jgi:hypothetical protein
MKLFPVDTIHIEFGHPYLLALLVLVLVPFYLWRLAKNNYLVIRSKLGGQGSPPRFPAAHLLLIVLLVVASSSPSIATYKRVKLSIENIDKAMNIPITLVVAIDLSKSMGYKEGTKTRLNMAKELLSEMLTRVGNASIVVLGFSATTRLIYKGPPSNVSKALQGLRAGEKYSAIGDALSSAATYLRVSGLPGALVVVTDGGWNYGPDPVQVAESLKERHIPVLFVIVGSDPRGYKLEARLRDTGVRVYRLNQITYSVLESLAMDAAKRARLQALTAKGETSLLVRAGRRDVSWIIGASAIAPLVLVLRRHGV